MIRTRSRVRVHGRYPRLLLAAAALAAAAVVAPACGSSSGSGGGPYGSAPASAPAGPGGAGTALTLRHTSLGSILTTGQGMTVYAFEADKGTKSTCSGACAQAWPPVTTASSHLTVAGGADKFLVGETIRPGGARQLTYGGHPLYTFAGDTSPGSTNGQGSTTFGARWDVLGPAGTEVTGDYYHRLGALGRTSVVDASPSPRAQM